MVTLSLILVVVRAVRVRRGEHFHRFFTLSRILTLPKILILVPPHLSVNPSTNIGPKVEISQSYFRSIGGFFDETYSQNHGYGASMR